MITADEYLEYCDIAWDGYVAIVRELGDDLVTVRPAGLPGANTAYGLIAHVVGVAGRWARTVNRGIVVPRDRDAEFLATGTVAEALALVDLGRTILAEDVASTPDFAAVSANPPIDRSPHTCGAVLLHVYEELAQHLGQLEVIRDMLVPTSRRH